MQYCEEINEELIESTSTYMGMSLGAIMRKLDPTAPSLSFNSRKNGEAIEYGDEKKLGRRQTFTETDH